MMNFEDFAKEVAENDECWGILGCFEVLGEKC